MGCVILNDRLNISISSLAPKNNKHSIIFVIIAFLFGYLFDNFLFVDNTLIVAYVPLMIIAGLISRHYFYIAILSFVSTISLYLFSPNEWNTELFILRWTSLFLIGFIINGLIKNVKKEEENLLNLTATLAESIDARDKYTAFHSKNVAYYSREIAKAMDLPKNVCHHIYVGGLLHDIGKIGIPEMILNKPSRLTDEEFQIIKQHPEIGFNMLKHIPYFKKNNILNMVLHHHERYDGEGYPYGIPGEEIPLVSRIMAVADAFDAMTSRRVYRDVKDVDFSINELRKGSGTQFDPEIAAVFLELIEKEEVIIKGIQKREEGN